MSCIRIVSWAETHVRSGYNPDRNPDPRSGLIRILDLNRNPDHP